MRGTSPTRSWRRATTITRHRYDGNAKQNFSDSLLPPSLVTTTHQRHDRCPHTSTLPHFATTSQEQTPWSPNLPLYCVHVNDLSLDIGSTQNKTIQRLVWSRPLNSPACPLSIGLFSLWVSPGLPVGLHVPFPCVCRDLELPRRRVVGRNSLFFSPPFITPSLPPSAFSLQAFSSSSFSSFASCPLFRLAVFSVFSVSTISVSRTNA